MCIRDRIIVLCNIKPAKFRGVQSNGMLLAAESPETRQEVLTLLTVMDESIPCLLYTSRCV